MVHKGLCACSFCEFTYTAMLRNSRYRSHTYNLVAFLYECGFACANSYHTRQESKATPGHSGRLHPSTLLLEYAPIPLGFVKS